MHTVYIDAETASDLNVRVSDGGVGAHAYVEHPSTRPILWAVHHESVGSLVFEEPDLFAILSGLKLSGEIELVSWGAFDRLLVEAKLGVPKGVTFRDLMQESLEYGAPASLEDAAPFWCGERKDSAGTRLIKLFSLQQASPAEHPIEWEQFRQYARQDVDVLPKIDAAIRATRANGGHDPAVHVQARGMVERMNARGIPVDRAAVDRSLELMAEANEHAVARCQELCGLNPTQLAKLGDVLGLPNMQAETVEAFIETTDDPVLREIAELQQSVAGAAVKKLPVMQRMAEANGRVRGCFRYHGAHTRRLTAHDLQPHNFVRAPYDPAFFDSLWTRQWNGETEGIYKHVRQNIRGYLATPKRFVAGDFKAIECRVINWLAGEQWVLDAFRQGGDPYRILAREIFQCAIDDIDSGRRQVGKIGELALGFGGGKGAVKMSGRSYGLQIEDDFAEHMKKTYRDTHPNVVDLWAQCERAMRAAIAGQPSVVNGKIWFEPFPWFVRVTRPSGYAQYFWHAQIVEGTWDDGQPKEGGEIAYVGRTRAGKMMPLRTYGGDIAQGVTQGLAADLMLEAMLRVESAGLEPVMSIHDEGVFEYDPAEWEGDVRAYVGELMEMQPTWGEGLPIEVETWEGPRFTKA